MSNDSDLYDDEEIEFDFIHKSQEIQGCPILKLPPDILRRIFSYFSTEDKLLCLEKVCRTWKESMIYSEMQNLIVSDVHRKLCRRGSSCKIDFNKRFQITFQKPLLSWLSKLLAGFVSRCASVVKLIDISGFPLDDDIIESLKEFPRLNNLNVSNCDITPSAVKSLALFELERLTIDGGEIEGAILQNMNVKNISLSSSKIALHWLPKDVTSLEVRTLNDEGDLSKIFQLYPNLKSFQIAMPHSIQSLSVVEIFEPAIQPKQLISLTITMIPTLFDRLCASCPNLIDLKLQATQDKTIQTNLNFMLSLNKLQKFRLNCRWLNEFNVMTVVTKCRRLIEFNMVAKKVSEFPGFNVEKSTVFELNLEVLNLALDCITVTTRIAAGLMTISPNIKKVKLMKNKMKISYSTEHSVSDDSFCVEYNEAVYASKKLRALSLPCLVAEKNSQFLEYLSQTAIEKLFIYGGCFYFEENDIPKFSLYADLSCLMLGPFFQNLSGLENLLPHLTNLRRLSLHTDCCTSDLLNVIGSLKNLQIFDMRCCCKYFMENMDVEMIPLLNSRQDLQLSFSYLSPLFINVFKRYNYDHPPVSHKLETEFDNLAIRFKVFFR